MAEPTIGTPDDEENSENEQNDAEPEPTAVEPVGADEPEQDADSGDAVEEPDDEGGGMLVALVTTAVVFVVLALLPGNDADTRDPLGRL